MNLFVPRQHVAPWITLSIAMMVFQLLLVSTSEASSSWTGTWQTQWRGGGALLHLQQEGDRVTGTYPLYEGRVEGSVEGRTLEGRWFEESGRSGAFLFTMSSEGGDFMGRFDSGEWWTGTRLSGSHEFRAPSVNRSSPRETLRSFIKAANAARAGFIEQIRPGLETIDFSNAGWRLDPLAEGDLLPQERLDYARKLFRVLDELTFRLWDLPGASREGPEDASQVQVWLKQAGTSNQFGLEFVRRGESWQITPPAPEALEAALKTLYERRGGKAPLAQEHLQLATPRATMRTFLEGMANREAGGWEQVERTMYVDGLGTVHDEEARLLAQYLKKIIDRVGFVIYQEIPDDPSQGDVYVHFRHGAGDIVIAPYPVGDDRIEWRFSADTLRSLRSLYAAIDAMPDAVGVLRPERPSAYFAIRGYLRRNAPWLLRRVGSIEGWQWLAIGVFLLTSALLALVCTAVILRILRRRQSFSEAVATGRMRIALVWPLRITFIGLFWYLKVGALGVPEAVSGPVRSVAATLAISAGVWLVYRGLGLVGRFSSKTIGTSGQTAVFTSLTLGIIRIVVVVVGALLMADAWSLPYSSVLAGLGVGGLALALAAKETVQNMIAGFTLFVDSPLSVGDFCRYGNKLGTVEEIGLRSTRIRSRDRTVVSIPNSEFANMQLENFAMRDRILLRTTIGLRYETTPDQLRFVLAELRRLLIAHPMVDEDPARVRLVGFGAYSMEVEIYAYVRTSDWNDYLAIREDLYLRLMHIVDSSGAQFAFPSQVNYLARDHAPDPERTKEAEEAVAAWRSENQLPFPEFDPATVAEIDGQLDYPPQGSCPQPTGRGETTTDAEHQDGTR